MAVRHLGELKKKILWSQSLSRDSRIHLRCRRTVHFSQALEAWTPANLRKVTARIPGAGQPSPPTARGAGSARSVGQRRAPRPGTSGPRFHPGRAKQTSGLLGDLRKPPGNKRWPLPPQRCVPPPAVSPGPAPGTPARGGQGAAKPGRRPRLSAQPRTRGRPRTAASPPARSRILGTGRLPHLPAGPSPCPGPALRRPPADRPARGREPGPPPVLTVMLWKTPPAVAAQTYLASQ